MDLSVRNSNLRWMDVLGTSMRSFLVAMGRTGEECRGEGSRARGMGGAKRSGWTAVRRWGKKGRRETRREGRISRIRDEFSFLGQERIFKCLFGGRD